MAAGPFAALGEPSYGHFSPFYTVKSLSLSLSLSGSFVVVCPGPRLRDSGQGE